MIGAHTRRTCEKGEIPQTNENIPKENQAKLLEQKILNHSAVIGIIGMGYVGLPAGGGIWPCRLQSGRYRHQSEQDEDIERR